MNDLKRNFPDVLFSAKDYKRVGSLLTVQTAFLGFMGQKPYLIAERFPPVVRGFGWFLSYLYSGFVIMQTFHTGILFTKTTFDMFQHGELNEITDALTQVIICSFSAFSTCYWLWHMTALRNFIAHIDTNYWHHSLVGLSFVSSFESYAKARRITFCWLTATISGVVLWGVAPLLQGSHTLPLNCWYPFDPLQPWVYPFVYSMQMFTQINIGATYGCGSALYVSLIVLMLGQFDVLFCSLKNLYYHARLISGEKLTTLREQQIRLRQPKDDDDDEVNQYMFSEEHLTDLSLFTGVADDRVSSFQIGLHESIVKCVQLHQFILESCKILEDLFHPYCLVKSLQITIQLCLLVFVGVAGERSLMRVFNLFQYMTLTTIELVMFTFFGELLRQHSVRSGEAFWRSNWTAHTTEGRKDILIFLTNSRRSVKLTAGKFFIMDVDRFRSVVTQAFSFLTLLQKLAAKDKQN